ncbi:class II aldolase/adducin family protein [Duganella sp. HH105]|uniref:class II aldolase/adducin family protein n=1 Tax=Duganella sp. HH105 TaxID=1781067 RepID=UPI000877B438|nr:class II aldolase/adducin family protein [Duganella sp. HH105]OEZ63690.1 methylthioribulose-1-phosphate dehydratase [Duganella sp. HH105]
MNARDDKRGGLRAAVSAYCARIGADPLLVQGAGGNASWKDGDTMWVKASGTWLAEAQRADIFVPVDLAHLRAAIAAGDLDVVPRALAGSTLRPSIETLMHALMPQTVVLHLHAVEVLAHLVRADFTGPAPAPAPWCWVEYHKPGTALAGAIAARLREQPDAQIVFLLNHGVVIGGADVGEVEAILTSLLACMRTEPVTPVAPTGAEANTMPPLTAIPDEGIQQLALDPRLYKRLRKEWALCPDHVVFLGAEAACYADADSFVAAQTMGAEARLAFIAGVGVYAAGDFGAARTAQLRCYYDILARQPSEAALTTLSTPQLAELLDWDAERYRLAMAR